MVRAVADALRAVDGSSARRAAVLLVRGAAARPVLVGAALVDAALVDAALVDAAAPVDAARLPARVVAAGLVAAGLVAARLVAAGFVVPRLGGLSAGTSSSERSFSDRKVA